MNLQTIFDQLTAGELRTVYLGELEAGKLPVDKRKTLITHLNMALDVLHRRFLLKEQMEVVNLVPGQYSYPLQSADILRVEGVRDLEDNEYLLNVLNDPESIHTPNYKTLDIPNNLQTERDVSTLQVFYRAKHPVISQTSGAVDPATIEVDLPYTHLEALIYFMASRVLNPVGMSESFHEGNNYAQKYEMACQKLELSGYGIQQDYVNDRFLANGWV